MKVRGGERKEEEEKREPKLLQEKIRTDCMVNIPKLEETCGSY